MVLDTHSISTIILYLIFTLPMLNYYSILGIGLLPFLKILLLFLLVLSIISNGDFSINGIKYKADRCLLSYFIWLIMITIICALIMDSQSISFNNFLMCLISILILLFLFSSSVDYSSAYRIYSFFIWTIFAIQVFQWLLFLAGHRMSFNLLPWYSDSYRPLRYYYFGMNGTATSLFSEPAHISKYYIPYVVICLFEETYKIDHRILKAAIISGGVISTASGNGVILLAIVWGLFFLFGNNDRSLLERIIILLVGIVAFYAIYLFMNSQPAFQELFSRLFVNTSNNSYSQTKAAYRIYRGWDYFFQLPWHAKLFGVGYSNMRSFTNAYNITSVFDRDASFEYFSGIIQIMCYTGIIGTILYLSYVFELLKSRRLFLTVLLVVEAALWVSSSMLFNTSQLMFVAIINAAITSNDNCQKTEKGCKYLRHC